MMLLSSKSTACSPSQLEVFFGCWLAVAERWNAFDAAVAEEQRYANEVFGKEHFKASTSITAHSRGFAVPLMDQAHGG